MDTVHINSEQNKQKSCAQDGPRDPKIYQHTDNTSRMFLGYRLFRERNRLLPPSSRI
jgi:hypothetical protein